ncbi:MAG: hypothetical protein NC251_07145 [Lachnoclostridium sp.]|nr:hypothetical protein [Lachnospira sp.]MCM1248187.1 hypothetical protein [Lachnoclostridium sp.]MCM1534470.1 hypothetical protein [Clostridium sp.]
MNGFISGCVVFVLLLLGFFLLFWRIRWLALIIGLLRRTGENMEEAARLRLLENRKKLLAIEKENSLWIKLEQELQYSGLRRRFPLLTAERWLLGNLMAGALLFLLLTAVWNGRGAFLGVFLIWGGEFLAVQFCKMRAMKAVNENLLKFLDFLGNYSITAGEVTGTFHQISRYVEEPLKSALQECCYEAQTTGDAGLALLSMAEKIEHPKFKEFVRNMEINLRYCADFTRLVGNSRRSMRDYLKQREERKSMIREASVNMVLLLGMSVFVFLIVDRLIEASIWMILFKTLPGQAALLLLGVILCLFLGQIYRIQA